MKNTFKVLGIIALLALALSGCFRKASSDGVGGGEEAEMQADGGYDTSGIDEDGYFISTGARDTWLLGVLKDYPYYSVGTGGQIDLGFQLQGALFPLWGKEMTW